MELQEFHTEFTETTEVGEEVKSFHGEEGGHGEHGVSEQKFSFPVFPVSPFFPPWKFFSLDLLLRGLRDLRVKPLHPSPITSSQIATTPRRSSTNSAASTMFFAPFSDR